MTVVRMFYTAPTADGSRAPAKGSALWTQTARRVIAGTPDEVVVPIGFPAKLVNGAVDVTVDPTTLDWVWRVQESIIGLPSSTVYVIVPDVQEIDFPDLVRIDPATLAPEPDPSPAWVGPLTELDTRLSAGVITADPDDPGFFLIGA